MNHTLMRCVNVVILKGRNRDD
eukprot:UN19316